MITVWGSGRMTRSKMWRHIIFAFVPFYVNCIKLSYPGPKYPPTKGEVWPKPQHQIKEQEFYVLTSSEAFYVTIPYHTCDILEKAVSRLIYNTLNNKYKYVRRNQRDNGSPNNIHHDATYSQNKTEFKIQLYKDCEQYPNLDMDEKYNITVGKTFVLSSASIWGILRGLESFNHLLYFSDDYSEIRINFTSIVDYPAYKYRGLLIDTGRHYLSPDTIHSIIDAMEINKMNVLHWHIVDDQSFPYQSERFPALSKHGAYHSSMVYTKDDIIKIVEHARFAGIRVVPEFDVPGHVRSWGEAFPNILTKCYLKKNLVGLGPLNPTKNKTYEFLQALYQEVRERFPDEYIHLGGDEVDLSCWQSNPKIRHYMKKNNVTTKSLHALFMNKVKSLLVPQTKYMIWQEVFDEGVPLPKKTIIQVWKYEWIQEMDKILKAGYRVVFSSSWYLDYLNQGWETFFRADPRYMVYKYTANDTGLEDIVGGEACMWGEMVDDHNIGSRIWPRASAVAERLWTGADLKTFVDPVTDHVRSRIEEHSCRMIQRGIPAEPPNGPGFCIKPAHKKK